MSEDGRDSGLLFVEKYVIEKAAHFPQIVQLSNTSTVRQSGKENCN